MRRPGPRLVEGLAVVVWLTATGLPGCARPAPVVAPNLDPVQQLKQDISAATTLPGVQRASWGIVVHSLDRDERLFELNPRALLVPASAAKIVSVASAVDAVGWDYRFETVVRATAPVVDGMLAGDLVVVGSGDPTIAGRGGADLSVWVDALKAQGLRRIDGRVIGDDDPVDRVDRDVNCRGAALTGIIGCNDRDTGGARNLSGCDLNDPVCAGRF
jgi:D-alanyl-D-alanine carboxypeptidase